MICPKCSGDVCVIQNINVESTNQVLRRRKCLACDDVFFTREIIEEDVSQLRKEWNEQVSIRRRQKLFKKFKTRGDKL